MLTAVSVAFKAVVGVLVRMITGPLGVPGGALAGGFYMLWLPLAVLLTGKRGSAFVIAAVQTVIMITTGMPGSHGVWTVLTYMLPAIFVELTFIYRPKKGYTVLHCVIATILSNAAGTFGLNLLIFRMSALPLLFTILAAALSGAIGGVIAWLVYTKVAASGVLKTLTKKGASDDSDSFDDIEKFDDFNQNVLSADDAGDTSAEENDNEKKD